MHTIKHSNWILGLGVVVAIVLIATTIWLKAGPEKSNDTVINEDTTEIGHTFKRVDLGRLAWLSSLIKTLN